MVQTFRQQPLLGPADPRPFDVLNRSSTFPVVIVCEHAGRAVPERLDGLGVGADVMDRHVAFDIGAGALARCLAQKLGATTVLQPYSRLVIDCNRPLDAPDLTPAVSDHIPVPANRGLDAAGRQARIEAIFEPFQQTVGQVLDQDHVEAALSIHSFTPAMDGVARPWDIGFCQRRDAATAKTLAAVVGNGNSGLVVGFDQPYPIEDESDFFIPRQCEPRGLRHCLIEVRNDRLADQPMITGWCDILANAIRALTETA